ncbi:MAG: isoprenylcysteine carboxylmethyltransferase family protein [Terriglobales bacterium]|jgi:protein-S-isoprenylcysteine O-methyltransferase Ste14
MRTQVDALGHAALILLFVSWFSFALIFLLRKRPPATGETKRAPAAKLGIALQATAYAVVWSFRRSQWWPFPASMAGEVILATVVVVVAWVSNWWCLRSIRTLGKQWTVEARLIKGHELITAGPYGVVRNPIYLGMFGLLVATGLALSQPWAMLAAIVAFLVGNRIRIRAEERLLRESFGPQFEDYARRVPAFLPRIL